MNDSRHASSPSRTTCRVVGSFVALLCIGAAVALMMDAGAQTGVARDPVQIALRPDAIIPLVEAAAIGADATTGTLTGTVLFDGVPPAPAPIHKQGDMSVRDPAICSAGDMPNEELVVNPKNKGIKNVFIYLQKAPEGVKVAKPGGAPLVFDQKGCQFIPHCMLVQVGQQILVKSQDPIGHNTHTNPIRNNAFNQSIKGNDRDGVALTYSLGERLPVKVVCDIHPWMKAYHLVLDHPFMAVTDEDGKFSIENLPAGKHEFIVWQEKSGYLDRKFSPEIKKNDKLDVTLKYPAAKFAAP